MSKPLRYIVVGAGMSGILAAVRLKQQGIDDFTVYEKGESIGGTWRENRYPGLTCDVPAHNYTYSFAPHAGWSAFYAPGPEIRDYFEKVVDDFGVRSHLRLNSNVTACEWDGARWNVEIEDGTKDSADIVIAASGVLHHINMPAIEGIESFAGDMFHSARWNYDVSTAGKRIGVIGNGSTGVQIVTALSQQDCEIVHFQRSPQWIMPVQQFAYSDEDRAQFASDPSRIEALRNGDEYWGGIRRFNEAIIDPDSPAMEEIERLCRENLETSVRDPELREKLRPDYRAACKRLIYSWGYYDAAQRPNVAIEVGRIARIEPEGVRMADGTFYELDVIALATGFRADRFIRPTRVIGRDAIDLDDVWRERPSAHYAVTIPGFPNFFMLNGPTGPVGNFSLIDIAERQWDYIEQLLEPIRSGAKAQVECRSDAFDDYNERRTLAARDTIFGSGCTSWYLDKDGVPLTWPWSYDAFAEAMEKPRLGDFAYA
ncbi:NAD(P)/FAD-dependent oxidoreductase [Sphingopyxis sp. OPL5]|uniref:flavin-containing monooxygenase n=1 Tax=Sphingopyxis sp. OPL5 TaxID=2486273 RepID=UPI00164D4CA1|nr:NAD(P)/FAD-dependent oxidoreductase [Sphingopyxis sp. OPL5]QNO27916.1 NAD(P)/FAD-dependent oxidoreductase [Sphingopyxis sp. OPL5]